MEDIVQERVCKACGETKAIGEYPVVQRTATKIYRTNTCSPCYNRARAAKVDPIKKAAYNAKANAVRREKKQADPEYREKLLAKRRQKQNKWRAEKQGEAPSPSPSPTITQSERVPHAPKQQQRHDEDEKRGKGRPPKPPEKLILTDPKPDRPIRYLPAADYEQEIHDAHRKECVQTENKKPVTRWANHTAGPTDQDGRHILTKIDSKTPTKAQVTEVSDAVNKDLIVVDGNTIKHISDLKCSVVHDRSKKYVTISYEVNNATWEEHIANQKRRSREYNLPYGMSQIEKD